MEGRLSRTPYPRRQYSAEGDNFTHVTPEALAPSSGAAFTSWPKLGCRLILSNSIKGLLGLILTSPFFESEGVVSMLIVTM